MSRVTAQINLAPPDLALSKILLRRTLSILSPIVSDIVLTLEPSPGKGRFSENWAENLVLIENFLSEVQLEHRKVDISPVGYDEKNMQRIKDKLKLPWKVPLKDFRGGPFYSYLYGLACTDAELVFHLDSDIILGGDPTGWLDCAKNQLEAEDVVAVAPLAGPPTADGSLRQDRALREDRGARVYTFETISTRVFMTTLPKLAPLFSGALAPRPRDRVTALIDGNPMARLPEDILTSNMTEQGRRRLDVAGPHVFWTLHPPYKSDRFLAALPEIISAIDGGEVPDAQRGFYDINAGFYDFSEEYAALAQRRWWKRLGRRVWG